MIPVLGVPVLNRPELLLRMLDSIDTEVEHLVVVDNGACLQSLPYLPQVRNAWHLRMPTNLGVPVSWNLIIKSTPFAPYWLIVNSDAWFPAGSLAALAEASSRDTLVLSAGAPPWCAFAVGDEVVRWVGLFDEFIHPAYFEDTDYERRTIAAGLQVVRSGVQVSHDNSSTLKSDERLRRLNDATFRANYDYYRDKDMRGDLTSGTWSLDRRRDLSWD